MRDVVEHVVSRDAAGLADESAFDELVAGDSWSSIHAANPIGESTTP